MRRAAPVTALLAAGLLAAGCSSGPAPVGAPPPAAGPAVSSPTEGSAPPSAPSRRPVAAPPPGTATGEPVTIAFAGDTHFERGLVDGRVPAGFADVLRAADVAMVNLETAVTSRGEAASKQYVFRGPASALDGLTSAGIDVVTLANNHGEDYGRTGLLDTLDAAAAHRLPLVGAGRDADQAYAPFRTTVKGQRLAFLGATQVLDSSVKAAWTAGPGKPGLASAYEVDRLVAAVREARATSDTVVVFLHWGVERSPCPPPQATTIARTLADAGADVVVGSHAHVLLGDGRLGGAYVAYGLGNFLFYSASGATAQTGVLTLTVRGRATTGARFDPGVITAMRPVPLTGAARDRALREREQRRTCTGLEPL